MKIKELLKENDKRYFETNVGNTKVLFYVYEFDRSYTMQEIEDGFKYAALPEEGITNGSLLIYQLDIYKFGSFLKSMYMSIWDYLTFINGINNAPKALKMAFISQENTYFYIACESNDSDSMVTRGNMQVVNKYITTITDELKKLLHKDFSHVEAY
jgi:hypothetical protein